MKNIAAHRFRKDVIHEKNKYFDFVNFCIYKIK